MASLTRRLRERILVSECKQSQLLSVTQRTNGGQRATGTAESGAANGRAAAPSGGEQMAFSEVGPQPR